MRITSMGFTRAQLEEFRGGTVDDLIDPDLRLLFVGINPGLWTAATNTHFCHPSNRFYPALRRSGVIDWELDTDLGMTESQRRDLTVKGIGITNLVPTATARASEVDDRDLRRGVHRLQRLVASHNPSVVAVAGVTAYRIAFGRPKAVTGLQQETLHGSQVWVVPNPSGLNAHETVETLGTWYRKVAEVAGVL